MKIESSEGKEVASAHAAGLPLVRAELMECLFCFKHPAFSEEDEWRIVYFRLDHEHHWRDDLLPLRFRERGQSVLPYVELSLPDPTGQFAGRLPIAAVICGPTQRTRLTVKTIRMLLDAYEYSPDYTRVVLSSVPLRA